MSFTKITNADFNNKGALSLPDQPTIAPQELKRKFDEDAREVVTPKFNNLIDELGATTAADNIGIATPSGRTGNTIQAVMNSVSGDLATLEGSVAQVIADDHTHANKTILDGIDDNGSGKLTYNGSVVGETDYSNLSNKPSINSVTLSGNKTSSDLGLMPATTLATVATSGSYNDLSNKPTIPTALSDLTDDSTHRVVTDTEKTAWGGKTTVGWSQITTTGQKIATVTIDGTPTDVYAPTGGGGGGGGNVDSVNGQTGTVVLDINDINDTTLTSLSDQDILVYNGTAHVWENEALKDVALTGDYSDLSNTPTIPSVDQTYNASSTNAQSGTAVAGALATLSIPADLDDLSDVSISGTPMGGDVLTYSSGSWTAQAPASGGHTMKPDPTLNPTEADVVTWVKGASSTNDQVPSLYGVQNWSNAEIITLIAHMDKDDDTVGTWEESPLDWKTTGVRTGWIWHSCLYNIVGDNEVEISIDFDVAGEEVVGLYAYRVDDNVQNGGVDGGAIAIKLTSPIKNASGVDVAVNLKRQRTQKFNATILS